MEAYKREFIQFLENAGVLKFGDFTAVDANFTFIFINIRLDCHFSVTIFRFGGDFGVFRTHFDKLFIVANTKGRARTKVKNSFRTVGFPLRVFSVKEIDAVGKSNFSVQKVTKPLYF